MNKKEYLPWEICFKFFRPENILMASPASDFETKIDYSGGEWQGFEQ